MTYWYRAFGQLIRADFEIPEYRPHREGVPDISIRLGDAPRRVREHLETVKPQICGGHLTDDGVLLHFQDAGDFLIRNGNEITVAPLPGASMNVVRLFLAGSAMGVLFHQRGQYIFHGAAVLTEQGASVFVGESGAGKSTLAAHLAHAGFPVLSDDTLPLFERDGGYVVWPGAETFKMWRDALAGLGTGTDGLPFVGQRYGKYFLTNPVPAPGPACPDRWRIHPVHRRRLRHRTPYRLGCHFSAERAHLSPRVHPLSGTGRALSGPAGRDLPEPLLLPVHPAGHDATRLPEAVQALRRHWQGAQHDP